MTDNDNDLNLNELVNRAVLHIGMASGALFELEGEAAHQAYSQIMDSMSRSTGFVKIVSRRPFIQHINLARIEAIDWYPEGTAANV